ncbi:MAG: type II secretion system protein [Gemmatimonadales bacterium]
MQVLTRKHRAFTLIEMVVVLAVMGIALAVVAPSMILPRRTTDIGTVVADARNAALRRSELVTLAIAPDGKWSIYSARSGSAPLLSGRLNQPDGFLLRIDISPLGLCTMIVSSMAVRDTLDPLTCAFNNASRVAR